MPLSLLTLARNCGRVLRVYDKSGRHAFQSIMRGVARVFPVDYVTVVFFNVSDCPSPRILGFAADRRELVHKIVKFFRILINSRESVD